MRSKGTPRAASRCKRRAISTHSRLSPGADRTTTSRPASPSGATTLAAGEAPSASESSEKSRSCKLRKVPPSPAAMRSGSTPSAARRLSTERASPSGTRASASGARPASAATSSRSSAA